jgi:hypothetical protein
MLHEVTVYFANISIAPTPVLDTEQPADPTLGQANTQVVVSLSQSACITR